jgi:hypothetical protein
VTQYPALQSLIEPLRVAFVASISPLFTAGVVIGVASIAAGMLFKGSMKQQLLARQMAAADAANRKDLDETPTIAPL